MDFLSSFRNLKKWFTDKTVIPELKKSNKRKHDERDIINNKSGEDNLIVSDDYVSEAEEMDAISELKPFTMPRKASSPIMIINDKYRRARTMWPVANHSDLDEDSDDDNYFQIASHCVSYKPTHMFGNAKSKSSLVDGSSSTVSIKEPGKSDLSMESHFSALKISNTSDDDTENKSLNMISEHDISPKSETIELSESMARSPLSIRKDDRLNQSNLSQLSVKENLDISELSIHNNRIIKQDTFYERIIGSFKEKQKAIESACAIEQPKICEDIVLEKLELGEQESEKLDLTITSIKKTEIFPGFNKEVNDYITQMMSGSQNDNIIKGKNIKKSDLRTVYSPKAWLNDEVINQYLNMIVDRDPISLHTFDTFFYSKLSSQGYQSVRRWSRKKDVFACKKMFVPINIGGNHWCLICVNFIDKTVKFYDSLGGTHLECCKLIFDYLVEEHKNKKNEEMDREGWALMLADDCPAQFNKYDCGVFTCINADYLARDERLDFTQDDMPTFRMRICYEILTNYLCY